MKIKVLFVFVLTLVCGICLYGCFEAEAAEANSFLTLRINPEVGLFLNNNNQVIDVVSLNNDGDVILSDLSLEGKDVEDATTMIVDEAVNAGYIDCEDQDAEVFVDVEGDNETEITEKVKKDINHYFQNKGIFGKVSLETLEEYQEEATQLNLPLGKTKMILLALELNPELTINEIKDLSQKDLVKLCHKEHKENSFNHQINSEYKVSREALKEKYAQMFVLETKIEELKENLENPDLTEEDKKAIQTDIDNKQKEYDEYKIEYNNELDSIKEEYHTKQNEIKETNKEAKENKKNSVKSKNEKHEKSFNASKSKDQVTEEIIEYQNTNE